jgi:hypothetical protein
MQPEKELTDAEKADRFRKTIRHEAARLGVFNASVEHLESVFGAQAGSEKFDESLLDFCSSASLEFEPIDEHIEFRPVAQPPRNVLLEARARRAAAQARRPAPAPAPIDPGDDDE